LPQVFFLEVEPFTVIDRETKGLARPHGDKAFLQVFIGLKPTSLNLFTARGLFQAVQERSDAENFDKLKDVFIRRIETMRSEYADNRQFQLDVERSLSGLQMQRGTLFILRWLVSRFLKGQQRRIRRTDATDFFHAVVPADYCDFVLLDSDWRTGVEQIRSHLN